MDITSLLSANLQALMDAHHIKEHPLSVSSGVPKTSIRRIRLGEGSAQIDSVEKVAKSFGLRACDLLDPDLKHRIATGSALRMGEPKPPTMSEEEWKAVSPRARALVEDICAASAQKLTQDVDIAWLHDSLQRITKK